ncbi:hypothetical protein Ddye_014006 [Dipteronia dyeriana]|uniref:Uncharacterized protein n=1 Tax=Dipteronia dyeriana TaxID=168575 RepID=A0AAD9X799_9ROSI|nr:hypothetical protein Ddye_014006 [Dipteronia dyeriana]
MVTGQFVKDNPAVSGRYSFSSLIMSQFMNLEEGTSEQLPTGHRNETNTEVSGHIQRGTPYNSGVEVQGISSSNRGVNNGGSNFYASNLFLLQYFITVILLYIMFTRATSTWATLAEATWTKAAFNLLLYIHGGHVFGGLWYAFAVEKEIECWKKACKHYASECPRDHDFTCNNRNSDYKFINEFCPIKTRNTTTYDFGIYHDALESGIVEMWTFRRGFYIVSGGVSKTSDQEIPAGKMEETKGGVEFGNLFNNLPGDLRRNIKRQLCLELLKKIEEFRRWSEELLDELCDCAKPVSYVEHAEIVRRGAQLMKCSSWCKANYGPTP